jgi:C-terminal processing protease CtpA/Prc
MANSDYYVNQILEKDKDKKVEKVVIDIRQNGGGAVMYGEMF